MTTLLKLTRIGTSTGAVLPKEMLARMKVEKGDRLYDREIENELKAGREFMKDYRDTFKALAR